MSSTALTPLSPREQAQLINYNEASRALQKAVKIDDVKGIRDVSVAWRAYASQAKDTRLREWAEELKLRAERRAGEMLIKMAADGTRALPSNAMEGTKRIGGEGKGRNATILYPDGTRTKLDDLGITRRQSSEWQKLAKTPEPEFEKLIKNTKQPRPRRAASPGDIEESDDGDTPENSLLAVRKWAELAANYAPEALREVRTHNYTDRAAVREVTQIINDLLKTWTKVHKAIGNQK